MPALEPYEPELPSQQAEEDEEIDFNDPEQEEILRRRMREAQENEEEEARERLKPRKNKASSGVSVDEPVVEDPYANDESSFLIPVLVAIGAFIPLLFCLCKI